MTKLKHVYSFGALKKMVPIPFAC